MFFTEVDNIYFSKTKEYMKEVIESYSIGNYRSATVLLYSVAICDIMLKLQELIDMYNDTVATEILSDIEMIRKDSSLSKSKWEKKLLDRVYDKTELLDDISFTNLNHLYDHRNFCAHPALNDDYELFSPTQEIVAAHIKNVLTDILIKPPIFVKSIVDHLTNDLDNKRDIYINDKDNLKVYLNNRYFSKMSLSMIYKVFKALWKFCFYIDDEQCNKNRLINRYAISTLFQYKRNELLDFVKNENDKLLLSNNDLCLGNFVIFISDNQEIYKFLNDDQKLQIEKIIEKKDYLKCLSWFKYKNLKSHIEYLLTVNINLKEECLDLAYKHYCSCGCKDLILNFFIELFSESCSFDDANEKFDKIIEPYLEFFSKEQYVSLIKAIDANDQIYNRWASRGCNNMIVRQARFVLQDFNFENYPNFIFDYNIIDRNSNKPDSKSDFEMPFG